MKTSRDNKQYCAATLTDLSKAFDCICFFFADITSDIANYADGTTPYECVQHCDNLVSNLELTVDKIFSWFEYKNAIFSYHLIDTL